MVDQLADRALAVDRLEPARLLLVLVEALDVEALLGVDGALRVREGHDPVAGPLEQARHVIAGVAEALDRHADVARDQPQPLRHALDHQEGAAPGGLVAAEAAAGLHRLAGDHARCQHPADGAVLVRHPAHDARVGVDVGRRDVPVGAHHVGHRAHVGAREALQLQRRELLRVDHHAALAAAVGETGHRALQRHPEREGLDLFERDVRVVADAPLGGAEGVVPAAAEGGEVPRRAVVHADREARHQALERVGQGVDDLGVDGRGPPGRCARRARSRPRGRSWGSPWLGSSGLRGAAPTSVGASSSVRTAGPPWASGACGCSRRRPA